MVRIVARNSSRSSLAYAEWRPIARSGQSTCTVAPAAAIGFVIQYAIGANATFSVGTVLNAMVGSHILIGIGEAIITALTVSAVLASRSDLVFGWDSKNSPLEIRS